MKAKTTGFELYHLGKETTNPDDSTGELVEHFGIMSDGYQVIDFVVAYERGGSGNFRVNVKEDYQKEISVMIGFGTANEFAKSAIYSLNMAADNVDAELYGDAFVDTHGNPISHPLYLVQ